MFGTDLTTQIIQSFVFLLPKLVVAGLILLAGAWLGQYLGRSMLVWAVNENFPSPRRLAAVVRILIMFVAVVVAADQLNFARSVFLAAFIIFVGGAVLAASLAIGLGSGSVQRFLEERERTTRPQRKISLEPPVSEIPHGPAFSRGSWPGGRHSSPPALADPSGDREAPGSAIPRTARSESESEPQQR